MILFLSNLTGFAVCTESKSKSCCKKCNMDSFKMESVKFVKNCACGIKKSQGFNIEANIGNFVFPSNFISHYILTDVNGITGPDFDKSDFIRDIYYQKFAPDKCIVNCIFRI